MKIDHKKFVKGLFFLIGLILSAPAFSQQPIKMTLELSPNCPLQYSDMQIQNGGSQLPVSSTGVVYFPAEDAGLPIGNASMTSTYCDGVCSPCSTTGCPYGNNLADCLSECIQQIFVTGNNLLINNSPGTISIECNPPPPNTGQEKKVRSKKR